VVKYITDSYSPEVMTYKVLAFDIHEALKQHLTNLVPNLTPQEFH